MIKLQIAKDFLIKTMKKYPVLGKIRPVTGGIKYGRGKFISNTEILRVFDELTEDYNGRSTDRSSS